MKKWIFVGVILCVIAVLACIFCRGGKKADDVTALVGVYEGEATLELSDQLKNMAANVQINGQKPEFPEGPIPCKVKLSVNENGEIVAELIDFKMPIGGMNLPQSVCSVTWNENVFTLHGAGHIDMGSNKFNFSYQGNVADEEMNMELKLVIIPFIAEPKVVFKGEKI